MFLAAGGRELITRNILFVLAVGIKGACADAVTNHCWAKKVKVRRDNEKVWWLVYSRTREFREAMWLPCNARATTAAQIFSLFGPVLDEKSTSALMQFR